MPAIEIGKKHILLRELKFDPDTGCPFG